MHDVLNEVLHFVEAGGEWGAASFPCHTLCCCEGARTGVSVRVGPCDLFVSSCGHKLILGGSRIPVPWWAWRLKRKMRRICAVAFTMRVRSALVAHLTKEAGQ